MKLTYFTIFKSPIFQLIIIIIVFIIIIKMVTMIISIIIIIIIVIIIMTMMVIAMIMITTVIMMMGIIISRFFEKLRRIDECNQNRIPIQYYLLHLCLIRFLLFQLSPNKLLTYVRVFSFRLTQHNIMRIRQSYYMSNLRKIEQVYSLGMIGLIWTLNSDAIWRRITVPRLSLAPSHYLKQCWPVFFANLQSKHKYLQSRICI